MDIKYFVRTTGSRQFDYHYELPEYYSIYDREYLGVQKYIDDMFIYGKFNSVVMEDDIQLCKNFKERIEVVINEHPNEVINFFMWPHTYFTTHKTTNFLWCQCVYYPAGVPQRISIEMSKIKKEMEANNVPPIAWDELQAVAMQNLRIPTLAYRPCLVQHIGDDSIIQKGLAANIRDTEYFIDYLEEGNINYETLNEDDNYTKLKNIFFKYRGKSHEEFEKNIGNKVAMSRNHEFIVRKCLLLADEHAMFLQEGEKENE